MGNKQSRPPGGRHKRAHYSSKVVRVPSPIFNDVAKLIENFYAQILEAENLPTSGHWSVVLGLPTSASPQEIRKRYRFLAKIFHPDIRKASTTRFVAITQSYNEALEDKR